MKKNKLIFVLLIAMLTVAIMPGSVFALSGSGTQESPYIISSVSDLMLVKNNLDCHFKLGTNIELTSAWYPIGTADEPFTGGFDGDGHTISGLSATITSGNAFAGLFGYSSGTIKNVTVKISTGINVTANESAYVGGIVAFNSKGTVTNCIVEGAITINATTTDNTSNVYAGGIAGKNTGTILSSKANGSLTATVTAAAGDKTVANPAQIYAGGIAGLSTGYQQDNLAVVNVNATASSSTKYSAPQISAGGLVGENSGNIVSSYAAGNVTADAGSTVSETVAYAGGLIGKNTGAVEKTNAWGNATADTDSESAKTYAGGLIGHNTADISESFATGAVNAVSTTAKDTVYAGGLVGLSGGIINECYATGTATATSAGAPLQKGGLVGYTSIAVTESYYKENADYPALEDCGISRTDEQLKTVATFAGWDFTNTWKISADQNHGYPYLLALPNIEFTFQSVEYTYDGTEKVLTATNIPDYATVEYTNNKGTGAGTYDAFATATAQGYAPTVETAKLTINKKGITVSGLVANNKIYNGTTTALVEVDNIAIKGVIEGDVVSVDTSSIIANFTSTEVGTNIPVKVTQINLIGADAANYTVLPITLSADIIGNAYEDVVLEGSGTQADPYRISNETELNAIRLQMNAYFQLQNDITLTKIWSPIGTEANPFRGTLDGNGFTIGGINIDAQTDNAYTGLFGYNTGIIKNLNVNVDKNIYTSADIAYVGAIAGYNAGTITQCTVSGTITSNPKASFAYIGGIAGYNSGTITLSDSTATINGKGATVYAGALVGENIATLETSYATGNVIVDSALFAYAGGFAGNTTGRIANSFATGNVTINVSDVTFMANAGGFVGRVENGSIDNSYSIGAPTVLIANGAHVLNSAIGGFTSYNAGTLTSCFYNSDTSGATDTDKGTPKTTAQLKTKNTYTGWNFEVWNISTKTNNGYPYLVALFESAEIAELSYNNKVITVKAKEDLDTVVLIAASYNGGMLVDYDIIENFNATAGQTKTQDVKEDFQVVSGGSVKLMIWQDTNNIRPLCDFVEVSVN